jgi:hypothetical protein
MNMNRESIVALGTKRYNPKNMMGQNNHGGYGGSTGVSPHQGAVQSTK